MKSKPKPIHGTHPTAKHQAPLTKIAFGGANCDDVQGVALHRHFKYVDYVVRGEGEVAFVELARAIENGSGFESISGLCWRLGSETIVNRDSGLIPMTQMVSPNFDDYFEALDRSPLRSYVSPQLVLEAARGCWWGEKHHCTFCGLNGSGMKFRSKDPDQVWHEIEAAVTRYRTLDVMMVDNIMDSRYVKALLPKIEQSGWELRLHYEVKANLSAEDLRALKGARLEHIQPGVESLSTSVLKLMRKGTTGGQNVALLREAHNQNLTVSWNYLYGFPGECDQDYLEILSQLGNLVHLQPPTGAQRIAIERFSPLFNDETLGVLQKVPALFYRHIYDLPADVLNDLVFLFDAPKAGLQGSAEQALIDAVAEWRLDFRHSSLHAYEFDDRLVIVDRRAKREPKTVVFEQPWQVAGYLSLSKSSSIAALARTLETLGMIVEDAAMRAWWNALRDYGLVFIDNDRYTAIATRDDPSNIRFHVGAA